MSDLTQLKIDVAELSDNDLLKMVNEDIVHYEKEEITLAYDELERRGIVPSDEKPLLVSPAGFLLGVLVLIVELVLTNQSLLISKELLPWPRAIALAAFVTLITGYWHKTKFGTNFWKHFWWSALLVLLGSLALWDLPHLLQQRIPDFLAFGMPAALFALFLYWFYESYLPKLRQRS